MIRNITFAAPEGSDTMSPPQPEETTLRTRTVTVSPAEEYALRPGAARPISNELAAAILSHKGRAVVGNKGVVVDRKDIGGRFVYFHEDSAIINDFAARERRLFYVVNRQAPDILHLLDEGGCYLESLPLAERPAVLDSEAQAAEVRKHKTIINRAAARLQKLHGEDTREAIETLAANSREMQRVVQTLPAPCAADARPAQPARSTQGDLAAAGANRIIDTRNHRAAAIRLGRAICAERQTVVTGSNDEPAEDWSMPASRYIPESSAAVESW
jgi:hypothetical protein